MPKLVLYNWSQTTYRCHNCSPKRTSYRLEQELRLGLGLGLGLEARTMAHTSCNDAFAGWTICCGPPIHYMMVQHVLQCCRHTVPGKVARPL